jgi:diketogulonate reductase-like aldo/keto reductase
MELPQIGLGTWDLRGEECVKAVRLALDLGYRHIDTAHVYSNHESIGTALKGFDRSKIFITSKLALQEQIDSAYPELSVHKACEQVLKELKVDYLDLYLIHAPNRRFALEIIFKTMEKLIDQGKVRKVGVSNYTIHHLEDLAKAGSFPFANQVEFHPYLNQQALVDYCQTHQIKLISFRSFGKGKLLNENPIFDLIGAKYNKTGAQIILRWLVQKEIAVIPKASSESHLKENLDIFGFSLDSVDMLKLDQLNQNKRYCRFGDPEYNY